MRMAIFDTETTDLPLHRKASLDKQPHIIEFACIIIENKEISWEFETLIKPPISISDEITKITGLADKDVIDAPSFSDVLPSIQLALQADVVVAHNLPFDMGMVSFELARLNYSAFVWPEHKLCTAQLYHDQMGKRPSMKALYEYVTGVPLAQTHRAMDDAKALSEIVLLERLWELYA